MTKNEFKEKVRFLHDICGVPYTEIGKRIGVSGQYISCMMKNTRDITQNVLKAAENAEIFKIGGVYNG
jgi:hypothetical protein